MNYAVIGGTGLEHLALAEWQDLSQDTPYGRVEVKIGEIQSQEVVFISRHGSGHALPPHLVNYRANLWALRELGVTKVLATAAVGSLSPTYRLGDVVLLDQFLDFTKQRPLTFYEGGEQGVLHVDMTEPYCRELRGVIREAGQTQGIVVKDGATYVCTEGPRFETPAEIRMFQSLGGEVVGMTSVPEVVLARELGMCYASMSLVTNEAAGISQVPLSHKEVVGSLQDSSQTVARLLEHTLARLTPKRRCACSLAAAEAGKF